MEDTGILASRGEFSLGLVTKLDRSELLCNIVLLKYKREQASDIDTKQHKHLQIDYLTPCLGSSFAWSWVGHAPVQTPPLTPALSGSVSKVTGRAARIC